MSNQTPARTPDLANRFEAAWGALDERLTSAIESLEWVANNRFETGERDTRLESKILGVHHARYIFDAIVRDHFPSVLPQSQGAWHAWAWRTFTERIVEAWNVATSEGSHAMAEGLALALDYQRGYGPDVDAPDRVALGCVRV